jgi:hypothetical protein
MGRLKKIVDGQLGRRAWVVKVDSKVNLTPFADSRYAGI